jgi:hypothetical protein
MAKKTRTELSTLALNTNLPDNTTELITPTTERAQLTDERESVVNYKDDLGGVPNAGKFLTVAIDGESLTMVDAPTGDVTGTGTQYQLAVWDGTSALTGYAALTYINSILQAPQLRADSANGTVTINATDASGGTAWLYFQNASVLKAEISYFIQDDFLTIRTYQKDIVFERSVNTPTLTIDGTTGAATFSGNVGIGTTATQSLSKLNVSNASSGAITRGLGLYNVFNTVAGTGVSLDFYVNVGVNDRCARIISTQSTAGNYADLQFQTSNNAAPETRLTISSGGLATFSNGIKFGTGATLDAYEEGIYTPTVGSSGAAPSVTYYIQDGTYTRIGNLLTVFFDIFATVTGGSGIPRISLPITVSSSMAGYSAITYRSISMFTTTISGGQLSGFAEKGQDYIVVQIDNSGTNGFETAVSTAVSFSGAISARCTGIITYQV